MCCQMWIGVIMSGLQGNNYKSKDIIQTNAVQICNAANNFLIYGGGL